jgi:DNA-binding MarR family transcriptional regulator
MAAAKAVRKKRVTDDELARAAAFRTELRRFLGRTEAVALQAGLTPERYDLLLMIQAGVEAGSPVRVTDLCESLQLRQTAVTENVKRAVEAGLIERQPSPDDGRVSLLRLTGEGERRLRAAYEGLRGDRAMLKRAFTELDLTFRAASR